MSDDLFFEGDEPVEETKKKAPVKKKPVAKSGGKAPAKKGSGPARKAPVNRKPAANEAAFEFTPVVVILIAVIAILIGFLGGLLAANAMLPSVNTAPPANQQMPPQDGGMGGGGMGGMGGGMGGAPILDDEQMMGDMPEGHPPLDEDGNVIMPGDGEGASAEGADEDSEGY
ncbi:MAG: hypothetical protein FWC86_00235 [Coriobacteriia bacterium]|nr:hypothetical protein [Coriobacteriia bacterium]